MSIKRRVDTSKLRRPLKRSKITESVYGSLFIYVKFFVVWILVLTADFLLEFRFEYLWPFWLLMRSAYDSFKYQGLVFSLLFLGLALCSDVVCLMVLPIHWLFFAASTYVWVQFVWHTDRGLGLPTISMWLLFIYVEASVRLKELKNLPFHLDLCRPFAAHCIGYPVVTLGYGVKSYVGYKIRQRKIQQVSKENEFYMELINQSLPTENVENTVKGNSIDKIPEETVSPPARKASCQALSNGSVNKSYNELLYSQNNDKTVTNEKSSRNNVKVSAASSSKKLNEDHNLNELENKNEPDGRLANGHTRPLKHNSPLRAVNGGEFEDDSDSGESSNTSSSSGHGSSKKDNQTKTTQETKYLSVVGDVKPLLLTQLKEEKSARRRVESTLNQMESDLKRARQDLQSSRHSEQDMRTQLQTVTSNEKSLKFEVNQLKNDNEIYQQKIQTLTASRQQDRNSIATLERKLKSERDARQLTDSQLREERKKAKADEFRQSREENAIHEHCNARRVELEARAHEKDEKIRAMEREIETLKTKTNGNDNIQLKKETEALMSTLAQIRGKNTHLENSLSSETRLKLDLFSALGETRRRLEISQGQLISKEQEIVNLKARIAEVMAVMPLSANGDAGQVYGSHHSPPPPPLADHEDVTNGSVFIPKAKNGLL
ncbi:macoilin-like [Dendronephthya gigantea]|uniref:macoilin-like n=1 Tax=Dendronephthya gigantea TaxID=151771 RepID=UPI00106C356F|nr:macoilin-like [Dendronephthya gigantea]